METLTAPLGEAGNNEFRSTIFIASGRLAMPDGSPIANLVEEEKRGPFA